MKNKCPICGNELISQTKYYYFSQLQLFNCKKCDMFVLDEALFLDVDNFILPMKLRSCLYYYFTEIGIPQINRLPIIVHPDNYSHSIKEDYEISSDSIVNLYPDNYEDQVSMILVNLSNLTEYPGDKVHLPDDLNIQAPLFLLDSKPESNIEKQINWWISTLVEEGYIENQFLFVNEFLLKLKALTKVSQFRKRKSISKKCFIAMWFDSEVENARKAIINAVEDTGHIPIIIDMKEHNNQIVPEILYEIRQSKFVIADFTGHRGGVYFEAGYAQGYGKEVITTCKKNYFEETHFDLKQKNTIVWEDEKELKDDLIKRIRATVGIEESI